MITSKVSSWGRQCQVFATLLENVYTPFHFNYFLSSICHLTYPSWIIFPQSSIHLYTLYIKRLNYIYLSISASDDLFVNYSLFLFTNHTHVSHITSNVAVIDPPCVAPESPIKTSTILTYDLVSYLQIPIFFNTFEDSLYTKYYECVTYQICTICRFPSSLNQHFALFYYVHLL